MKKSGDEFYYSNEVYIPMQNYSGHFNDAKDNPPRLVQTNCYITFEANGVIKAGASYGSDLYGEPTDYFDHAKFTVFGEDFKVLMDMNDRQYLPELHKLKNQLDSNGCDAICDI